MGLELGLTKKRDGNSEKNGVTKKNIHTADAVKKLGLELGLTKKREGNSEKNGATKKKYSYFKLFWGSLRNWSSL